MGPGAAPPVGHQAPSRHVGGVGHVGPSLQGPSEAGHRERADAHAQPGDSAVTGPHIWPSGRRGGTLGPPLTRRPGPASASDTPHWRSRHPCLVWAPQRWSRDCNSWASAQEPRPVTACFDGPEHICKLQIPQLIFTYQAQKEASGKQTTEAT